jgi:hypothetical protein
MRCQWICRSHALHIGTPNFLCRLKERSKWLPNWLPKAAQRATFGRWRRGSVGEQTGEQNRADPARQSQRLPTTAALTA